MGSQAIEEYRKEAEIYHGDTLCKQKSIELLQELSLPNGLLPLQDIIEAGYNRSAGFVWLRQRKSLEHYFPMIGRTVSYADEITAFVENRRMKKITGVKSKELFIWLTVADMSIQNPISENITFKSTTGLSRTFPISAFQLKQQDE